MCRWTAVDDDETSTVAKRLTTPTSIAPSGRAVRCTAVDAVPFSSTAPYDATSIPFRRSAQRFACVAAAPLVALDRIPFSTDTPAISSSSSSSSPSGSRTDSGNDVPVSYVARHPGAALTRRGGGGDMSTGSTSAANTAAAAAAAAETPDPDVLLRNPTTSSKRPWTKEEDEMIIEHVKVRGANRANRRSQIAAELPGK